jgi:ribosomal protein L24
MDDAITRLLRRTPGVIHTKTSVSKSQVDQEDWIDLLTMRDSPDMPAKGNWVIIRQGVYKGDPGLVCSADNTGVTVLLVPRLSPPRSQAPVLKRKRIVFFARELFNPNVIKEKYGVDPVKQSDQHYRFKRQEFEHGLLRRTFNLPMVSSSMTTLPSSRLIPFYQSGHPAVSQAVIIQPSEWVFYENERVTLPSLAKAHINFVEQDKIQVETCSGEIQIYSKNKLRKLIEPGDFVEVIGGNFLGKSGWVVDVTEDGQADVAATSDGIMIRDEHHELGWVGEEIPSLNLI